ncbi:vascular endothelial growth factor C isoform X1 [Myxocyprinus asiaticus]|uniref:vascular endothelial growth factor C isoform X1 n=1 Tax=Myxocyprinus asiaticus TaxID=70543 RepID=UPI0022229EAF|nr:vascular endothelial growth factor C isoform X1 [Myxocyprinus asiaticus]
MHLFGISIFCIALLYANLALESSHDYYDYDQDQADALQEHSELDLVEQLRSAGSVDELMRIVYPSYWSMLKCRSKAGGRFPHRERSSTETRSEEASFAAAYFNFEILKSIETEWRKTLCMPRQVCLDVGKEFGAATNTFYKPPCVSVYRCGGCCNSEEHQCMNISTSYISKTLFEITVPIKQGTKPVTISFANHTSCSCLSKLDVYRQRHSIIRRALPECHVANKTCPKNHSWSNPLCRCVPLPDTLLSKPHSDYFEQDFCGPDKELDEETCQCVCQKQLRTAGCGPNRYLDKNTCQCVCKAQPSVCGPQQSFNKDTCQCICAKVCPKSQPLNRTKCVCECTESPNKCFLKGRRFHPGTCSCFRPPCNVDPRRRRCKENEYFSEELCHCIPTYWGRLD